MDSHPNNRCSHDTSAATSNAAPFSAAIPRAACQNQTFRTAFWTGHFLQMTLMSIPVHNEIGSELHADTEQFIRVEHGQAVVYVGSCKENLDVSYRLNTGDGIFIPAGVWHNVCNAGNCPLKLSSIYAPPHHPKGTVHRTKADAERKGT